MTPRYEVNGSAVDFWFMFGFCCVLLVIYCCIVAKKEKENRSREMQRRKTVHNLNDSHQLTDSQSSLEEVAKKLKSTFCTNLQRPVHIGMDRGKTCHFDWCETSRVFRISQCSTCEFKEDREVEEDPPAYEEMFP